MAGDGSHPYTWQVMGPTPGTRLKKQQYQAECEEKYWGTSLHHAGPDGMGCGMYAPLLACGMYAPLLACYALPEPCCVAVLCPPHHHAAASAVRR